MVDENRNRKNTFTFVEKEDDQFCKTETYYTKEERW